MPNINYGSKQALEDWKESVEKNAAAIKATAEREKQLQDALLVAAEKLQIQNEEVAPLAKTVLAMEGDILVAEGKEGKNKVEKSWQDISQEKPTLNRALKEIQDLLQEKKELKKQLLYGLCIKPLTLELDILTADIVRDARALTQHKLQLDTLNTKRLALLTNIRTLEENKKLALPQEDPEQQAKPLQDELSVLNIERDTLELSITEQTKAILSLKQKIADNESKREDIQSTSARLASLQPSNLKPSKSALDKVESEIADLENSKSEISLALLQNNELEANNNVNLNLAWDQKWIGKKLGGQEQDQVNLLQIKKDLVEKKKQLSPLRAQQKKLKQEKDKISQELAECKALLQQLVSTEEELRKEYFAATFWKDPDHLLNNFIEMMRSVFKKYEADHPDNQPIGVRLILANYEKVIKLITEQDQALASAKDTQLDKLLYTDKNDSRRKYIQLRGFLEECFEYELNTTFSKVLSDTFTDFDPEDCLNEFNKLPSKESILTCETLPGFETKTYEEERKAFLSKLNQIPKNASPELLDLKNKGIALAEMIEQDKKDSVNAPHSDFDLKFHTTILAKGSAMLSDPKNKPLRDEFNALTQRNQHGKSSVKQMIIGGCTAFAGALLLVASVVGLILTSGFFAAICVGGAGFGAGTASTGLTLFAEGREKGERLRMNKYASAAKKYEQSLVKHEAPRKPSFSRA